VTHATAPQGGGARQQGLWATGGPTVDDGRVLPTPDRRDADHGGVTHRPGDGPRARIAPLTCENAA